MKLESNGWRVEIGLGPESSKLPSCYHKWDYEPNERLGHDLEKLACELLHREGTLKKLIIHYSFIFEQCWLMKSKKLGLS